MLTITVRILFAFLLTAVGLVYGRHFYDETGFPVWLGGAIAFAFAITLIAAEQAFRRRFARAVVTVVVGLAAGLVLSYLILAVLDVVIQSKGLRDNIDLPLVLITTYLAIVTVLHHADRFRIIVPFVEFRSQRAEEGKVVLDATALADSRFAPLAQVGMLGMRLLVHDRVVQHCQLMTESLDAAEAAAGRRALATLADLRILPSPVLQLEHTDLPGTSTEADVAVALARLESARLCTADANLVARARSEELAVIDLAALGNLLTQGAAPGDTISVRIEREGEHKGQGVGFHSDGSMVVVTDAADQVGKAMTVRIKRLHHTAQGRMIFADPSERRDT